MKKILVILLSIMVPVAMFSAEGPKGKKKKADKNTQEWYYELEAFSSPYRGSCNVKVWSYGPDIKTARDQAAKNAVHGTIFRGIPGNPDKRLSALPALVADFSTEEAHRDFFADFFKDGGQYLKYATRTVSAGSDEIVKYSRRNYKVGVIITVQYDALRKMLEQQGITESLTSGFAK